MKLLYTFLISFLLINFNNTSAQTIEVDIEPLLKYIDDAQKCTDSIKYMPNFKEKVGHEVWLEIMEYMSLARRSRNFKQSSGLYSLRSIINFWLAIERFGVDTVICIESKEVLIKDIFKN